MTVFTIPKPPHGSDEWHEIRWHDPDTGLKRISASVAAAVHNEHRYTTKAELAATLLAPEPPKEQKSTGAQDRGHRLEDALIQFAQDELPTYTILRVEDRMYVAGRLIATLDAAGFRWGSRNQDPHFPVECKTDNDYWTGTLSRTWHWQGVQQAICTDADMVWWVIFDGRLSFNLYCQMVSDADKRAHTQACEEFLSWIDMGVMPPDCEPTADDVATMHPRPAEGKVVELTSFDMHFVSELAEAKRRVKAMLAKEKAAKAAVARLLGDAEAAVYQGQTVVTWKSQRKEAYVVDEQESRVMRLGKDL